MNGVVGKTIIYKHWGVGHQHTTFSRKSILNYFNYFTEIEDTFVRRRARHLMLSPLDWALIESWKEMGVPLHIALRGIEKAFDSWESKPRKRSVKTLLYCQEEVEAQYVEWLESRIGLNSEDELPSRESAIEAETLPFSRATILEHLRNARKKLLTAAQNVGAIPAEFAESLRRADVLVGELEVELTQTAGPDARTLEVSLTGIERMLGEALRSWTPSEKQAALTAEVKKQLKPYRSHMEESVYEQTLENLFMKCLREQAGVPRLSLFHLML